MKKYCVVHASDIPKDILSDGLREYLLENMDQEGWRFSDDDTAPVPFEAGDFENLSDIEEENGNSDSQDLAAAGKLVKWMKKEKIDWINLNT